MSESKEEEDSSPIYSPITITPPQTALRKSPSPTPSNDSMKKRVQFSSTPPPVYTPSQYYSDGDYTITPQMYIKDDDKILDISDDEKDEKEERGRNGNDKKFGPLILRQINALCNFIMLFGCGILLLFYFKSSIQSDYVLMAKASIITFLVIELIVRIINLLQMRYYDVYFGFRDGLRILCFKKESYLVFRSKWIELSQAIKLADTADDTCFIIPSLFLIHIIIYFIVHREDPLDKSCAVDNTCKFIEIILSFPAVILVITRIWFIINTIDYIRKVEEEDDDDWNCDEEAICCDVCCNCSGDWRCWNFYWYGHNYGNGYDCCNGCNSCNSCGDCCGSFVVGVIECLTCICSCTD